MTDEQRYRMERGIAAYAHEQAVLLRALRRFGSFTERDFDRWLGRTPYRRPFRARFISGDTFVLGFGANGGNDWALWLEVLQYLVCLGFVDTKTENGLIVYSGVQSQHSTRRDGVSR